MATASKSAKRRYEIVENKGNSEDVVRFHCVVHRSKGLSSDSVRDVYLTCLQDDIIEAQVSDNADDSTDEESSEYSGLEDDEEDDSGDEEDESAWEEASDEDEEDDDQEQDMSTNEDSEDDSEDKVAPTAIPIEQVGSSAPVEEPARPVEDEYAYDSSDEEVWSF